MDDEHIDFVVKCNASFEYFAKSDALVQDQFADGELVLKDFHKEWVDALENHDRVAITAATGIGKCVTGDTRIPMADGTWKTITEVEEGEKILSFNDETYAVEPAKVSEYWVNGVKDVYKVELEDGRNVKITSNHPFYTSEGWKDIDSGLSEGDYVAKPKELLSPENSDLKPYEARILGYLLAEGGLTDQNIRLFTQDDYLVDILADDLEKINTKAVKVDAADFRYDLSNIERTYDKESLERNDKGQLIDGNSGYTEVKEFCKQHNIYGALSKDKHIPEAVFNSGFEEKSEFVAWFWAGDGYISQPDKREVSICQASKELVEDIQHVLHSIGIDSRIAYKNSNVHDFDSWRLNIETEDIPKFAEHIDIPHNKKRKRLKKMRACIEETDSNTNTRLVPVSSEELLSAKGDLSGAEFGRRAGLSSSTISSYKVGKRTPSEKAVESMADVAESDELSKYVDGDIRWSKIKNIEYAGKEETYDITVPGNHSFIGNGMVLHNTTILGAAYPLWKIFTNPGFEILIVASDQRQSKKILAEIKYHIENSEWLQDLKDEKNLTWSKTEIELTNGSKVYCRPFNEGVKGLHVDLVLCDEAAEFKEKEIYTRYVRTRAARKEGTVCLFSTPVHENDLVQQLSEGEKDDNPDVSEKGYWNKTYPAEEEDGTPTFPEAFDKDRLASLREEDPIAYQKEYLCEPLAVEGDMFDPNDIIECYDTEQVFEQKAKDDAEYTLGCDFAISNQGDYSVFTVIEYDPEEGEKVVRHMERTRGQSLKAQEDRIEQLHDIFGFETILIDETNFGGSIYETLVDRGLPVEGQSFDYKARNNLLVSLKAALENNDFIIPRGNDEGSRTRELTDVLYGELLGFGPTETQAGSVTYRSTAQHDDTVVSLAMALSAVSEKKPVNTFIAY